MKKSENYISYYLNSHPLKSINKDEKMLYVASLKYINNLLYKSNKDNHCRISELEEILELKEKKEEISSDSTSIKSILKRKFKFFYFYTYAYIFLMDSFLIFLPKNYEESKEIVEKIKEYSSKAYLKKIEQLNKILFSEDINEKSICKIIKFKKSFINKEIIDNWTKIQTFINTKEKKIIFTATMSAGKSSLINAIAGREISYSMVSACTTNILSLKTAPINNNKFYYKDIENDEEHNLKMDEIVNFIKNSKVKYGLTGYFDSILSQYNLNFIDTPGIDNATDINHRELSQKYIKENYADILVYVIPVANYGSQADDKHLKWILENANYGKILFVVNMMDTCEEEKENISKILQTIRKQLEKIGYTSPIVCPLSSQAALLIKQKMNKEELSRYSERKFRNFLKIFSQNEMDMSRFYYEAEIEKEKKEENSDEELKKLYISTGLYSFEKVLLKYINNKGA